MKSIYTSVIALAAIAAPLVGHAADTPAFPSKPVRFVTTGVGGPSDLVARIVAQGVTAPLGQPVVVENRASNVLPEIVAKAPADGYTLMITTGVLWTAPLLQSVSYDPLRDFMPVSLLISQPTILVTHPSLPVKSVKELIALAKARPGELNYAAAGIGGTSHLSAELFNSMAGIRIVGVFYSSNGNQLNALISGEVQLNFSNASTVTNQIKSGRLRAVAVTSAKQTPLVPDLPTVSETGLPGYEAGSINGLFAPAKTPEPVIRRLNQEVVKALNASEIKEKLFVAGSEVVGSSPEQLASVMKTESAKMGKLIREAGIKLAP